MKFVLRFYYASSPRRFNYVKFEKGQNKRRDFAILPRHTHFYYDLEASKNCAVAASATIHNALAKILKGSRSAVQLNGRLK